MGDAVQGWPWKLSWRTEFRPTILNHKRFRYYSRCESPFREKINSLCIKISTSFKVCSLQSCILEPVPTHQNVVFSGWVPNSILRITNKKYATVLSRFSLSLWRRRRWHVKSNCDSWWNLGFTSHTDFQHFGSEMYLCGKLFDNDEEVASAVKTWLLEQTVSIYKEYSKAKLLFYGLTNASTNKVK